MKEYFASKELLLQQYEAHVRASLVATYFGRAAMLLLICLIAFIHLKVKLVLYAVLGASVLVSIGWFFEIWSAEKSKRLISNQIGEVEEGKYDMEWEDANIRIGYYVTYRMIYRVKRYFIISEPILWLYLIGVVVFLQGKEYF